MTEQRPYTDDELRDIERRLGQERHVEKQRDASEEEVRRIEEETRKDD